MSRHFYGLQVGLGTGLVGALFFAVRAVDIAFDPLIGVAGDRIDTPWGRRRPWLVAITPLLLAAVFCVVQSACPCERAVSFDLSRCDLFRLLRAHHHMAWGAELFCAYHERSRIAGARQIAFISRMLVVLVLPAVLELRFAAGAGEKVAAMGWFIIIGLPLTVALAVVFAGEPRHTPPADGGQSGAASGAAEPSGPS
jgi:glycoside/pentoside/hexuronide:cation symporter, GPH family